METTWGALMQDAKKASEPITEGKHRARIVDSQAGMSSTQKVMFTVKVEIVDGPDAKRKTTSNITLSPENGTALAIFFQNMKAMGLDDAFFALEPNPDQVAAAMVGREVNIMIKHETWQGVKRGKIDRWIAPLGLPGGSGPIAPGTVTGPAAPPLPTSNASAAVPSASPVPGVQVTTQLESVKPIPTAGPAAPTDVPPPLPI